MKVIEGGDTCSPSAADVAWTPRLLSDSVEQTRERWPDTKGTHVFVFVHGFQGSSWDLRMFRNLLQILDPDCTWSLSYYCLVPCRFLSWCFPAGTYKFLVLCSLLSAVNENLTLVRLSHAAHLLLTCSYLIFVPRVTLEEWGSVSQRKLVCFLYFNAYLSRFFTYSFAV
jgi:hypothetical protein